MKSIISLIIFIAIFQLPKYGVALSPTQSISIIDSISVLKSKRIMTIFFQGKAIKTYTIALGKNPKGKKQFQGDYKTPEGLYYIDAKSDKSQYHKNLNISYPNKADLDLAKRYGRSAGGYIKIHGLPNGFKEKDYTLSDWTWGCIGLTNKEIDEVYTHIKLGAPILILP